MNNQFQSFLVFGIPKWQSSLKIKKSLVDLQKKILDVFKKEWDFQFWQSYSTPDADLNLLNEASII